MPTHQLLLTVDDPSPVAVVNPDGASPYLLIGDHAGNRIPQALGDLDVGEADRQRHIAWDIGIAGVGTLLADRIDAVFVHQVYSRLVVDCNRAPERADAMPEVSDGTPIPGNIGLSKAVRAARIAAIYAPYQAAIADAIARRDEAGRLTILIALHSFTPRMAGFARPWEVGVLHHLGDTGFAQAVLAWLRRNTDFTVGDNEPYRMDGIDYTVPHHAYPARRRYAELEIRQDLIATPEGQKAWADRLARMLTDLC